MVVEDLFQPVKVAGRGHSVDQAAARAQHAAELGPRKWGKDVQQQIGPAIAHRGAEAAADAKCGFGQQLGRQAHSLFREVEADDGRFIAQCFVQVGVIAALAAAGIHDVGVRQRGAKVGQCLHQRGVMPGRKERAAGAHHLFAIAGVGGVLFLDGQQIGIPLFGKVKAVGFGAAQAAAHLQQRALTNRAAQGCG